VLRAHIEKTERAIAERDAQLHDARASLSDLQQQLKGRLHELAQRGNDVHFLRDALAAARRTIVERDTDLAAAARTSTDLARALAEDRRRVAALIELVGQHRIRLAAQVADAFVRRAPHLYRLLRPAMVAAVARWRPAEKTP
jgi:chromosome segregation ATPase